MSFALVKPTQLTKLRTSSVVAGASGSLDIGTDADTSVVTLGRTGGKVSLASNVGVGVANPTSALEVNGDASVLGNVTAVSFVTSSDARVKVDVEAVDTTASLDRLLSLSVKRYGFSEEFQRHTGGKAGADKVTGFIAQEVRAVLPSAVDVRGATIGDLQVGDFHYLKKEVIFTEAVAAIQELHKQLAATRAELAELRTKCGM